MRSEGASHEDGANQPEEPGRAFPRGGWEEPSERLDALYLWVERRTLLAADRYLTSRVRKRRAARVLRAGAALGATAGAVMPLLTLTRTLPVRHAAWVYLALLLCAAVCVGADRCFGLTTGWIRDVATAQALHRRLESLQFDWASEAMREALGPVEGSASEAAERGLAMLRSFAEDVSEIVRDETADWMLDVVSGPSPLRLQTAGPRLAHPVGRDQPPDGRRFLVPPGFRPAMPRQRPPEGTR